MKWCTDQWLVPNRRLLAAGDLGTLRKPWWGIIKLNGRWCRSMLIDPHDSYSFADDIDSRHRVFCKGRRSTLVCSHDSSLTLVTHVSRRMGRFYAGSSRAWATKFFVKSHCLWWFIFSHSVKTGVSSMGRRFFPDIEVGSQTWMRYPPSTPKIM